MTGSKHFHYSAAFAFFLVCVSMTPASGQYRMKAATKGGGIGPINLCITPCAPTPFTPVDYVTQIPDQSTKSASKGALSLKLEGKNLEAYSKFEVYINGRKSSSIEAILSPLPRGAKGVISRNLTIYFKGVPSTDRNYKLQYRHNLKSKDKFTKLYTLVRNDG